MTGDLIKEPRGVVVLGSAGAGELSLTLDPCQSQAGKRHCYSLLNNAMQENCYALIYMKHVHPASNDS